MSETKHTPLEHTQNCAYNDECQKNPIIANTMAPQRPMSEFTREPDIKSEHALSAENQTLKSNGQKTDESLSKDMAENVNVAEKESQDFSQSTTSKEMEQNKEEMALEVGDFINGLLKTISLAEIIDCFVSTVIALEDSTEHVRTKNNASLIAAAPDLLEALELFIRWDKDKMYTNRDLRWHLNNAELAIAKAKGAA